jgi:methionine synthase II (cobalamin-independent)
MEPIRFRACGGSRTALPIKTRSSAVCWVAPYDSPMFATLLGGLPRPPVEGGGAEGDDMDGIVAAAVRAQEDAGLEPITDGRLRDPGFETVGAALLGDERDRAAEIAVELWRTAADLTGRAVKQALPGPYALAKSIQRPDKARAGGARAAAARAELTRQVGTAIGHAAAALASAGCPLVEVEETGLDSIAEPGEAELFDAAHRTLIQALEGTHLSLSIVGAAPMEALRRTILELPYASLGVDLIVGPDSWNLVTRLPGDRGVIAGVESARTIDEPKEVLLWAAHYAASTGARGLDRVGLGSAGSWANLTWDVAVRKMRVLAEAAQLASMPPSAELARSLDPRAVDSRRAALGHDRPRRSFGVGDDD